MSWNLALCLTLKSLNHLELICLYLMGEDTTLIFPMWITNSQSIVYWTVYPFHTELQCQVCHMSDFDIGEPDLDCVSHWSLCHPCLNAHFCSYIVTLVLWCLVSWYGRFVPNSSSNVYLLFWIHFRISLSSSTINRDYFN